MIKPSWLTPALAKTVKNIFEFVALEARNASLDEIAQIEGVGKQAIWFKVNRLREKGFIPQSKCGPGSPPCLELTKVGREYVLEFEYLEEMA